MYKSNLINKDKTPLWREYQMSRLKRYVLNEDVKTDFIETCACIGIVITNSQLKQLKQYLSNQDDAFTELLETITSQDYDWNSSGVNSILSTNVSTNNAVMIVSLIQGMKNFVDDVASKIGSKLYFIHDRIADYYKIEERRLGKIKGAKKNTADCLIMNVPADTFFSLMKKEEIEAGDENINVGSATYYQVSLKKGRGNAQIGKITTMISTLGLGGGLKTGKAATEIVDEGIIDNIVSFAKNTWHRLVNFVNSIVSRITTKYIRIFMSKPPNRYLNDLFSGLPVSEGTLTPVTLSKISDIVNNKEIVYNKINSNIKILEKNIDNAGDLVYYKRSGTLKGDLDWDDENREAFALVGNYLTIRVLQDMVSDVSKLSSIVSRLIAEMFFGGTKLPLWKVYGETGSGRSYEFLGTIDTYMEKYTSGDINVEILGIRINITDTHYSITIAMLKEIGEDGKTYVILRTGTNSSSGFTFIVEGTAEKTIDMDEGLSSILGITS